SVTTTGYIVLNGHIPFTTTGTVDPATGAFSGTGEFATPPIPTLDCQAFVIENGIGDGEEIHQDFRFTSANPGCRFADGRQSLTKCGNGELDPLEDNGCEGGPIAVCCSPRCRLQPAGTPCDDNNPCTTGDACAADGTCVAAPAAGTPCDDNNP